MTRWSRAAMVSFGVAVLVFFSVLPAIASAWTHVAQAGENLEQLARRYYGKPELSHVIRAANGFVYPDNGSLTQGESVKVPEVYVHRFADGDSWADLAAKYLGTARRGLFLAKMNNFEFEKVPATGTLIKIPYHLKHIFAPGESLKTVTKLYYGKRQPPSWISKYNFTKKRRFGRGEALIIPLVELEFTPEERERIEEERASRYSARDADDQKEAIKGIAELKSTFEAGKYVEMIAIAERLRGKGRLTIPQQIGVYMYLAFAYVALAEKDLAEQAFLKALRLQPGMDLSPITTSPKILEIFTKAKRIASSAKEKGDNGAEDAPDDPDSTATP